MHFIAVHLEPIRGLMCFVCTILFAVTSNSFFVFPSLWSSAMDLLVCVAEVWVPGIGRLWPDIYFDIHPERKGSIETSFGVAGSREA